MNQSHTKFLSQDERRAWLKNANLRLKEVIKDDKLSTISLLLGLRSTIEFWEIEIAFHTDRIA